MQETSSGARARRKDEGGRAFHLDDGRPEDLDPEGERSISAHIKQATGHDFVFVTHCPVSIRPFYHLRPADDPSVTASFDLLWKGLEVTTGAQREHRYDVLLKQAVELAAGHWRVKGA